MRTSLLGLALPALAGLSNASPAPRGARGLAPIWTPPSPPSKELPEGSVGIQSLDPEAHLVKDSYIIVFKDDVEDHHIVKHKAIVELLHSEESATLQKRGLDWGSLFKGLKHHYAVFVLAPGPRTSDYKLTKA